MAFKMKPFSGFGNSPMKNKKNFEKFQAQKQKAKDFVKNLKPQIAAKAKTKMVKQVTKKGLGALARRIGPIGVALTAYDIAKSAKRAIKGLKKKAKSGNVNIGRKL